VRGYLGEYEFVMDSWYHASVGALLCGHYVTLLFSIRNNILLIFSLRV